METEQLEAKIQDYLKRRPWKEKQLDEYGTWQVYGESPDGDLTEPSHYEPYLGAYKGKFLEILTYAVNLDKFYFWGIGGKIKKAGEKEHNEIRKLH